MNYIRHLSAFFNKVKTDDRLTAMHVSLYIALFQYWNLNRFQNPFKIYREDIMKMSRIGSKNTYYKSIKQLHQSGYIIQHFDNSKYVVSKISIIHLDKKEEKELQQLELFNPNNEANPQLFTEPTPSQINSLSASLLLQEKVVEDRMRQGKDGKGASPKNETGFPQTSKNTNPKNGTLTLPHLSHTCPKNGTVTVPHLGHLIKHINSKHINEENSHAKNSEENCELEKTNLSPRVPNVGHIKTDCNHFPSPSGEGGRRPDEAFQKTILPKSLTEVELFFQENKYPSSEALKFFHHYQSNGWLIAGKTPMKDWHASAHKWMLNVKDFKPPNSNDLNNNKDYSQPL